MAKAPLELSRKPVLVAEVGLFFVAAGDSCAIGLPRTGLVRPWENAATLRRNEREENEDNALCGALHLIRHACGVTLFPQGEAAEQSEADEV